jgi:hypothetical protein
MSSIVIPQVCVFHEYAGGRPHRVVLRRLFADE